MIDVDNPRGLYYVYGDLKSYISPIEYELLFRLDVHNRSLFGGPGVLTVRHITSPEDLLYGIPKRIEKH